MSDSPTPGLVRQVVNVLGDVGGFVAVLVAYVLALTGRSPGPIPQTTAVITVIVTTAVVWAWRANRITRREATGQSGTAAGELSDEDPPQPSLVTRLLDPFRNVGNPPYVMPLGRRRVELSGLALLTVAAVAWTTLRLPQAIPELTGFNPPGTAAYTCDGPQQANIPRVVIADFEDASDQYASNMENRLFGELTEDESEGRVICRLRQVVGTRQEAQELGRRTQAVLVVWGRSDVVYDVHLEIANSSLLVGDVPGRDLPPLPSAEVADFDFALREPLRLGFLTDLVLSQVLYLQRQPEAARVLLAQSLARAEEQNLAQDSRASLGEAYFFLGYLYDPNVAPQPDAERALDAYSRAIVLNPDLHVAILNRGKVYEYLDRIDLAIADYSQLIAAQGPLAADAAVNRAFLQPARDAAEADFALAIRLDPLAGHWHRGNARLYLWNDPTKALADFVAAVQLEPTEYFYYDSLGQAQLMLGQSVAARQTYRAMLQYLDQTSRQDVIAGLAYLVESQPDLADDVSAIAADLQAAPLPRDTNLNAR